MTAARPGDRATLTVLAFEAELTALGLLPAEPREPRQLTRRQERMETLASLRLWDGNEPVPPPGYVTAHQAAERLGVTSRTVERYKRELARRAS